MKRYDVIIVGAGPAGIFAALELVEKNGLKVLMVEKGKDIDERQCPMSIKDISCNKCPECDLLSGWGGAGAFSDGKLNLSPEVGGFLTRYVDTDALRSLIDYVDKIYVRLGAPEEIYGTDTEIIRELERLASKNDLILVPSRIRHIGTDMCRGLLKRMRETLNHHVDVVFESQADKILVNGGKVKGIRLTSGEEVESDFVILAPGREGSRWLEREVKALKLTRLQNPVDIGVRVEIPASVFEHLTKATYEPKLIYYSKKFDDKVRTFCVNPYGEVVKEYLKGIWTVNGHSYAQRKTGNTNFALLVSTVFTEPFNEPISYGRYVARLANFLGQGVIVQRLGDLHAGRRSTHERISKGIIQPTLKDTTPGDLSFVLPYRYLSDIMEMLEALDRIAPGVNSRHTLLYGVEVKFYSMQLKLTNALETETANLFAIGDGAGVSRGLVQASVSGVIAAREILNRLRR
ncbi:MAG: NAD(P)/FAD-dependent oxidoreductase [Nitrospirae bacterium]|nr:NAD(P)/FAD-dependent oxidoreductase [Nitrospirota bacterium]MCL5422188.1 NAD(P)/FAD-dependent oxidoreductase [Nitrospirota bacterium]